MFLILLVLTDVINSSVRPTERLPTCLSRQFFIPGASTKVYLLCDVVDPDHFVNAGFEVWVISEKYLLTTDYTPGMS